MKVTQPEVSTKESKRFLAARNNCTINAAAYNLLVNLSGRGDKDLLHVLAEIDRRTQRPRT